MALSRKPIEIVNQGNHQLLTKASHWERVPLSDVAVVQNGFAFKSELFTHSGGKPLIRIRDIEDGWTENFYTGEYSDEFLVRKGDILIGMDGDFNAAIWQGVDGLLNQRVCRLIPISKNFSDKFLFLCLQPYLNAINAETSSVTVKHLSSKTIGDIPLPLPPLNEQHRIVAKIEELFSELDKGIENLKTAQSQLKVYRQALLKHAFEGKLTAQWRAERNVTPAKAGVQPLNDMDSRLPPAFARVTGNDKPLETAEALLKRIQQERAQRYQQQLAEWEKSLSIPLLQRGKPTSTAPIPSLEKGGRGGISKPKPPKSLPPLTAEELSELPELPEGWAYTRVGALIDDPTYGTSKKCDYEVEGIGVLRIPNVISGKVDASDLKFAQFTLDEIATYKLNVGDILIIRSNGSVSIVGRCALVSDADLDYLYAGYLIRLRPHQRLVEPGFLLNTFSLHSVRKQIEQKAKSTSGVNNINTGEIQSLVVALCGIEEQKQIQMEIEARLSEVDQLDQTITTSLQQAEALRQSILKKAFSGQLVPQDPNDEPASELLARIRAERVASQGNLVVRRKGGRS